MNLLEYSSYYDSNISYGQYSTEIMLSTSKFRGGTNYIMLITLSLIVSLHYVSAMDNSVPGVGAISTPFSLQGSIETHGVVTVDTSGMNKYQGSIIIQGSLFVDNVEHKGPITITGNIVIENTLTTKCDKVIHVTPPTPPVGILPPIEVKKYSPAPIPVHQNPPPPEVSIFVGLHRIVYIHLVAKTFYPEKNSKMRIDKYCQLAYALYGRIRQIELFLKRYENAMNIEEVVYIVGKYYQLKGDLIVRSEREKKEWYKQLATVKMFPIPIRTAADVFNPQR